MRNYICRVTKGLKTPRSNENMARISDNENGNAHVNIDFLTDLNNNMLNGTEPLQ